MSGVTRSLVAAAACLVVASGSGCLGPPEPAGTIHGIVIDAAGDPVSGVPIGIDRNSFPFTDTSEGIVSGEDGTFEIRRDPGNYTIRAEARGEVVEVTADFGSQQTTDVELMLGQ